MTTFDATPLSSVPTGTPELPTGNFIIPVSPPSLSQSACIQNTAQSNAWSCFISLGPGPLQMSLSPILDNPNPLSNFEMVLNYGNASLTSFTYGAQAPTFSNQQVLRLVSDVDETDRGPAWWFQMPYDKLVILKDTDLTPQRKRDDDDSYSRAGKFSGRKGVLQTDDIAWFCYWNGTVLEGFIYPNQTTVYGSKASASITAAGAASSTVSSNPSSSTYSKHFGSTYDDFGHMMPPYGKVVKIEEHRMSEGPNVIPPYCVKTEITDGGFQPIVNTTGQPITVYLNESASTSFAKRSFGFEGEVEERGVYLAERQANPAKQCGCVWLYQ